jgi:hypothetical protein
MEAGSSDPVKRMRDAKMAILEDQLDALVGRVGDAEERLTLLVRLLTSKNVAARLGLARA